MNKDEIGNVIRFLEAQLENNRRVVRHLQETGEKLGSQINLFYRLQEKSESEGFDRNI